MPEQIRTYLAACPAAIQKDFKSLEYLPGSFLLTQGDEPGDVFILLEGQAMVYLLTPNGVHFLEYIYKDNEIFGEIEALNEKPIVCSVVARSLCKVIQIGKRPFIDWMRADTAFAVYISRQLAEKFYQSNLSSATHIAYPLRYRMLFFLWQSTQQGNPYIRKEDVVRGLGSNERSTNRVIKQLVEAGLVEYDRGVLKIGSLEAALTEMSQHE